MVELDGPVIEGFIMASSKVSSGGFASLSIAGCSGVLGNGEGGLAGSDASPGGSSAGLAATFLDLAWPLRKNVAGVLV